MELDLHKKKREIEGKQPSLEESHVHGFSLSLGSWVSPLGFVGSLPKFVDFGFFCLGSPLGFAGSWVR